MIRMKTSMISGLIYTILENKYINTNNDFEITTFLNLNIDEYFENGKKFNGYMAGALFFNNPGNLKLFIEKFIIKYYLFKNKEDIS